MNTRYAALGLMKRIITGMALLVLTALGSQRLQAQIPDGELGSPTSSSDVNGNLHIAMMNRKFDGIWNTVLNATTGQWTNTEEIGIPSNFGQAMKAGPALVAVTTGVYVFAVAVDGRMIRNFRSNDGQWDVWTDMGGFASSMPSAVGYGDEVFVFMRGRDNRYWFSRGKGNSWSDFVAVEGLTGMTSGPAVASIGPQSVALIGRGSNGRALWGGVYENGAWGTFRYLNKDVLFTPTAWGEGKGNFYASIRVDGEKVRVLKFNASLVATEDYLVTGYTRGLPATSWMNGVLTLVVIGDDGASQWLNQRISGQFGAWRPVAFPSALSNGKYIKDIAVVVGNNDAVLCPDGYHKNGQDLNQKAGGKYIYACVLRTNTRTEALRTIDILNRGKHGPNEQVIGLDKNAYYLSAGCGGTTEVVPQDLNAGAGGSYIYFCKVKQYIDVGKTVPDLKAVTLTDIMFRVSLTSWADTEKCGASIDRSINIWQVTSVNDKSEQDVLDLNHNAGGRYIWLCVKQD